MIGKSVSNSVLDGWMGGFYQWDGEVKVGESRGCFWVPPSALPLCRVCGTRLCCCSAELNRRSGE